MSSLPTQADILRLLRYDATTGVFFWREKPARRIVVGSVAGKVDARGAVHIGINGARYLAHRLAWVAFYGIAPNAAIDHIDGDPSNNAICNLRDVDCATNLENLKRCRRHNKTGLLGVGMDKERFRARITVAGRLINLGGFATPEEAHQAYISAKRRLHKGCAI